MAIGFGYSSSMNSSNEMLGCKSLSLSCVRSIEDEALKFCHIAREEEASRDRVSMIRNQRLRCHHASIKVHQAYLISTVITIQMNG